jgi:hypothetical protein
MGCLPVADDAPISAGQGLIKIGVNQLLSFYPSTTPLLKPDRKHSGYLV